MKVKLKNKPREFSVGGRHQITIKDFGKIELGTDEMVTFLCSDQKEYDVVRKKWGYYATPSVNDRLKRHRFKTALVRNIKGQAYIMLVEIDKMSDFEDYLSDDENRLVCWLDEDENIDHIIALFEGEFDIGEMAFNPLLRHTHYCGVKHFDAPPEGETKFDLKGQDYERHVIQCQITGHYLNIFPYDIEALYAEQYVNDTYDGHLEHVFEKIINLPSSSSDNTLRSDRVEQHLKNQTGSNVGHKILDVGSGLCVFGHEMKNRGVDVTCIDLDERQIKHAIEKVGVRGVLGKLEDQNPEDLGTFDLISFNKVLEHMKDPVTALKSAHKFLKPEGSVYIELPDGETAAREEGFEREEFFIDHYHVFSMQSFSALCDLAGFTIEEIKRIKEPSGKYTLFAFAEPV